jgi:type II secretory pathway pseudopilin PulG
MSIKNRTKTSRKGAHSLTAGFTIVELLIATTVFTMVLLVCAAAIVHIGRMFYKGVITNRTQDMSRAIANDVAQSIQFGEVESDSSIFHRPGTKVYSGIQVEAQCVGGVRYSYSTSLAQGTSAGQIRHVLWKDRNIYSDCEPINITLADPREERLVPLINVLSEGEELLGNNMRIVDFDILPNGRLYAISIRIAYGDDPNLFVDPLTFDSCIGANAGGQFCAISAFNLNVVKRL